MSGYPIAIFLLVSVATAALPTSLHSDNLVHTISAVIYSLKELNPLPDSKLAIVDEVREISELLRKATNNSHLYFLHNLTLEATWQWVSWNLMHG